MKQYHFFKYANEKSLAKINGSVEVPKIKDFCGLYWPIRDRGL